MAGSVVYIAGKWGIYPGIWRASSLNLSDADLRAPLTVQTRLTHRDLFNGVKGTFISPTNNWQIADFPPYADPAFLAEDSNERIWQDVEYPFTTSAATCQRISKINLRRVRRQISMQAQFKLTAYQVQPMDVIAFSHPRFGWVNKTFEVTACSLVYAPDASGNSLAVGVDLTLHESDSTVFDWSTADENSINAPPTTILPQTQIAQPPTSLALASDEIVRADGIRMVRIIATWVQPLDNFVLNGGRIAAQYKQHADLHWIDAGSIAGDAVTATMTPVQDGTLYDVQIWSINAAGVASTKVSGTITTAGTTSRSPSYSKYRPLTNPLTATDAGASATITVAAFTMRTSGLDISISSGSIGSLSYNTLYFLYYDDPNLNGGAVTFVATTTKETALASPGRFFVGSILTPRATAQDAIGNDDGGSGAESGMLNFMGMSQIASQTLSGTGSSLNMQNAVDGDATTFGTLSLTGNSGINNASLYFTAPPALRRRWSSAVLKYRRRVLTNTLVPNGNANGFFTAQYSVTGIPGSGLTTIETLNAGTTSALQTISVTLDPTLNLSQFALFVRVQSSAVITGGSISADIFEVWLEVKE
jgi:hypothetical protein